jgi:hypothetical protein
MPVFTDVNPIFQQTDIHALTNSPAMKLFSPPDFGSILFQEVDFWLRGIVHIIEANIFVRRST